MGPIVHGRSNGIENFKTVTSRVHRGHLDFSEFNCSDKPLLSLKPEYDLP